MHLRLKSIEEVDALKSDLLCLLQHETRTPLTGIIGSADLLNADELATDERHELAGMILTSAKRLHRLIEAVLTLVGLKAGTVRLELAPVPLSDLVHDVTSDLAGKAAQRGVTVDHVGVEDAIVLADRAYLGMALKALLDNAVRFSPAGGTVVVEASRHGDRIAVAITDQGPGITPDLAPRVFDEFVVADIRHHSEGLGLGLAIARRIILGHEGAITFESRPGAGATFRVELPLARGAELGSSAKGVSS